MSFSSTCPGSTSPSARTADGMLMSGYLFLCERLPRGHELELMLINTIRKVRPTYHQWQSLDTQDLSSASPKDILLALHAIVHLPSSDLAPAVQPLLSSKTLLRHASASIRQKTLESLFALHFPKEGDLSRTLSPRTFPIGLSNLVKLLEKETETGVVRVILDLMRCMVVVRGTIWYDHLPS